MGFVSLTGSFTERLEVPRTTASRGKSGSDAEASIVGFEEYPELLADYFPVFSFCSVKGRAFAPGIVIAEMKTRRHGVWPRQG